MLKITLRILDFCISFILIIILMPLIMIGLFISFYETGSPLFFQKRVGIYKSSFILIKLRTMSRGTPSVASHLVDNTSITPICRFLRKIKLDELPQLWNVLKGDMSLVGPRPNLFNQDELIKERDALGVYNVRPGITGLAQVNGIDMSTPQFLAKTDSEMIENMSIANYFMYILVTVRGKGQGDRVHF